MPKSQLFRLSIFVVVVLLLIVGGLIGLDRWSGRKLRDVPVPNATATPSEVVSAYLSALNARDCSTARALVATDFRATAAYWCERIGSLKHASLYPDPADNQRAAAVTAGVGVTFDLHWRLFHGDGSMRNGPTTWGYGLIRTSAAGRWLINEEGTG